ncbi:hypothetical protein G6F56_009374 [Rhizopus delemar]|nr:hypothetical protein G6F56_009374 [Rhizopus delemar]
MGYKDVSHHSMSDLLAPQVSPRLSDLDYSSSTGEFHRSLYQDNCVFDPSLYQPKKSSSSLNQPFYHPTVSRSTSSTRLNQPTSPTFSFHSDLLQSHKDEPTDNSFEDDYINQAK